jgi:hypothetical protein
LPTWRSELKSWREMHRKLSTLTEDELWKALQDETQRSTPRVSMALRLHQRYCVVRSTRERLELIKTLTS